MTNLILAELANVEQRTTFLRTEIAELNLRMTAAEQQMRRQVSQLTAINERFVKFDERFARIERRVEGRT